MNTKLLKSDVAYEIFEAVSLATRYWPNAHLGSYTTREDIRSAFYRIRCDLNKGVSINMAASHVFDDALRHADM